MTHIKIEENENHKIKIEINGDAGRLASMLASAILNDEQFCVLILTALAVIAEEKTKFPNINLN